MPDSAADIPAIETLSLVKHYGGVTALAGLTMSVPRGEIFGFLGANGAGKTTAVKLLLGLARPSDGEGAVLGLPMGHIGARRRIGYLPELFRYQDWLSAREVCGLHCALARIPRSERSGHIATALKTVGLTARAEHRVGTFSKGMQQRLGLAVALLGTPELIILDEPTSALDPVGRHDVRNVILDLKRRGTTVFLNSHLLTEVEKVCDRIAVIDRGRIVALGTLDELLGAAAVRVRVESTNPEIDKIALGFDATAAFSADGWITIRGVSDGAVPELVARFVQAGARVLAVQPERATLEDRFLQLLEDER
jgi:ABC-2 type transport system ATP-binding protein